MRVLVTGHKGYIGTVMVPMLIAAGHDVVGLAVYCDHLEEIMLRVDSEDLISRQEDS